MELVSHQSLRNDITHRLGSSVGWLTYLIAIVYIFNINCIHIYIFNMELDVALW